MRLVVAAFLLASAVPAAALTVVNSNGGDGFLAPGATAQRFTLFGSEIGTPGNAVSTFTDVIIGTATRDAALVYRFVSRSTDPFPSTRFNPPYYFTQARGDFFANTTQFGSGDLQRYEGTVTLNVRAGQPYGFGIFSRENISGRGVLEISAVPEPETWAMMILGFGLVGSAMRRRRATAQAA